MAFADLNNYVDLISCKFYIPLMRLFHLNSQFFAQKNSSHFTLFFIALGYLCQIHFCIPETVIFWGTQLELGPAFLSAEEMYRFAESTLCCNTTTETKKTKAKLKFILVETLLQ